MDQSGSLKKLLKYFELYQNIKTTYQNLWDIAKAGPEGHLIAYNADI